MDWARILAYVTGTVDQELLARIEYLAAENRILKDQLQGRLNLSDGERATLAEIGHRLGRKVLAEVATVARPDTILAWYRKLVAGKFDGSKACRSPGRPRIKREVEQLIVRMAKENHDWGYGRIVGALANLGYKVSDQTVGNVLQRHGLPPAPERKRTTTWSAFIRIHLALLAATDFFTAEVLTLRGLVTVNGPRNLPTFGRPKFPTLAGAVINRWCDRCLRSWAAGRGAWVVARAAEAG